MMQFTLGREAEVTGFDVYAGIRTSEAQVLETYAAGDGTDSVWRWHNFPTQEEAIQWTITAVYALTTIGWRITL